MNSVSSYIAFSWILWYTKRIDWRRNMIGNIKNRYLHIDYIDSLQSVIQSAKFALWTSLLFCKYEIDNTDRSERMANFITSLRIIFSIALLFCPALSVPFYAMYIAAGFTDMIDGTVARKTNSVSEFGSKLDTASDFALVTACLIKLIPVLNIEAWMYIWIAVIALIKVNNIISGYVMQKKLAAVHSVMNKVAGVLLFALPFTLRVIELKYSAIVVCAAATFAAVQEGYYIRTGRVEQNDKSCFL